MTRAHRTVVSVMILSFRLSGVVDMDSRCHRALPPIAHLYVVLNSANSAT